MQCRNPMGVIITVTPTIGKLEVNLTGSGVKRNASTKKDYLPDADRQCLDNHGWFAGHAVAL